MTKTSGAMEAPDVCSLGGRLTAPDYWYAPPCSSQRAQSDGKVLSMAS